ncbi:STAS domain-containing protein [Actinokineospora bangkokensis]|uniref:STAS domain-containing protein n=1 Tax=Actinokineospora bangkokensis TaxID=1193682 RepID=UPI000A653488|nr:STAS domain-containing protein [Actinokineospora bangkokensis]
MAAPARHVALPGPRGSASEPVTVTIGPAGRWAVLVAVSGEVDLSSAGQLTVHLAEAVATPDVLAVVLDLTGVRFLAASGLTALVRTLEAAEAAAVELHLVADQRAVLRPLQVTGLRERFCVHPDADAALARYASANSR